MNVPSLVPRVCSVVRSAYLTVTLLMRGSNFMQALLTLRRLSIFVLMSMSRGSFLTWTLTVSSTGFASASLTGVLMLFPAVFAIVKADLADFSRSFWFREFVVEKPHAPSARTRIAAPISFASVTASICPSTTLMIVLLFFCPLISAYVAPRLFVLSRTEM